MAGPQLTPGGGATPNYTELGAAVAVDNSITLFDPSAATLFSATVSIGSGFVPGDTLNFTDQGPITGGYDGATGVLTLTGAANVLQYRTALQSITFSSSSHNPTNFSADTSRTIHYSVSDGLFTGTADETLNITAVNDAPVAGGAGNTLSYTELATPATVDSNFTVSDVDSQTFTGATVSISAGFFSGDTLAATPRARRSVRPTTASPAR